MINGLLWPVAEDSTTASSTLQSVIVFNGVSWTTSPQWIFQYNSSDTGDPASTNYGDLTQITLPTGGIISYAWGKRVICGNATTSMSRGVISRTTNANDGRGSFTTTYGANGLVTDAAGNDTMHTITGLNGSCSLYETQTDYYQGTGSNRKLLKTVQTAYSWTANPFDNYGDGTLTVANVVPVSVTTKWPIPNSSNYLVSQVQTDYDNSFIFSPDSVSGGTYGRITEKREYGYGTNSPGSLLRRTDYTYAAVTGSNYLSANLLDLPNSVITYDQNGVRTAETDYSYDDPARLTSANITNQHGPTATAARGNLTSTTRWLNTGTSPTSYIDWYDTGEKYQDIDAAGHATIYAYSSAFAGAYVTQTQMPDTGNVHHIISGNYDFNTGLLTTFTDENNQSSNYSYDIFGRIYSASYPDGGQTSINYNGDPIPPHITKTVVASPNPSIITDYFYDGLARIKTSQVSDPQGADITATTYDALGQVLTVSNPYRSGAPSSTDGTTCNGTMSSGVCISGYDALGRLTVITKQDGGTVQTDYSAFPTVTVTDETGRQRRSTSDALGRLVEVDEPSDQVITPTSGSGSVTFSGAEQSWQSQTSSATTSTGTVTITGTEQRVRNLNDCPLRQICYYYDDGSLSITVAGVTASASYGQGSTYSSVASDLANAINGNGSMPVTASVSDGTITLTSKVAGSSTNYSLSAGVLQWDRIHFGRPSFSPSASGPNMTGGTDAQYVTNCDSGSSSITVNGHTNSIGWGQGATATGIASALASSINSDSGAFVSASASGPTVNLTAKTQGVATNYSLSTATTSQQGSFSGSASGSNLTGGIGTQGGPPYRSWSFSPASVTLYSYDALGNLTCAVQKGTDASAFTSCGSAPATWRPRSFSYDSLSRLLSASNPETGTITYAYAADASCNPAGENLRTKTDARGISTTYCYDALHRLTQKTFSDSTPALYFSYDVAPSWMTDLTNVKGRLVEAYNQYAGSSGSIAAAFVNSYDQMGRVIRQWQQTPSTSPGGYFVYPAYDVAGQLKSLTYPSGRVVNYHFDASARLYSVDGYLNISAFWPTGAWQNASYGNGAQQQDTYNSRLQPTDLKLLNSTNGSIADRQYFWTGCAEGMSNGNNGNVCAINDVLNSGRNQSYNYDALNRIVAGSETDGAFNQTMSYDTWANASIAGPGGGSRSFNTKNQDTAYGFDTAGSLTDDGTYTYNYDAEEQISSFNLDSNGSQVANYVYDADGNRVRKNVGSGWTEYIYFGDNVIAENSSSGWTDYVFAGGKRIAQVSSSGTQYYWADQLGTTKMTLDASGNQQCNAIYTPFGSEVSGCPTHYKFNAKERDFEDGLDYFGARYYSSNMGRWMSPDWAAKPTAVPYANFGNPQSLNLYSYVQNNPITLGDADGHCFWDLCIGEGAAVYVIGGAAITAAAASIPQVRQGVVQGFQAVNSGLDYIAGKINQGIEEVRRTGAAPPQVNTSNPASQSQADAVPTNAQSTSKPDFVVTPGGTAVPTDQDRMREGFDKAGFPSQPANSPSGEAGVIHTVPTANGPVDVRTMEGSKKHPPRAVITHPRTNSPKTPDGKATNNKDDNHIPQQR